MDAQSIFNHLAAKYGEMGRVKCVQDANFHLSYLADSVSASSPLLFSDYIGWAKVMLSARGVPATDLSRNISIMHEVVREKLPSQLAAVIDEDRAAFAAHRVRLAAGQASTVEFRVRTGRGDVRWLWERAQGRREGDRVIAVAAIADVTAWHPAADDRVEA